MKVLLLGISTRALAQSAVRAGYDVLSLDFFGDSDQPAGVETCSLVRDLGEPPDLPALARAARQLLPRVDRVVVEAGLENEPALLEFCPPEKRWGNSSFSVRAARDLEKLRQTLKGTGLQVPQVVSPGEPIPSHGHFLLKDLAHSGGMGVREWDGITAPKKYEILQEFVDGTLASACFVANGSEARLLGLTRQYAGVPALAAPGFAWCGNAAPLLDFHVEHILLQALQVLVGRLGLRGLNGLDFIIRDGVPYLLEVNPRPPASFELFERLLEINAFSLHVEACQGVLPSTIYPRKTSTLPVREAWAKGILYAPAAITLGDTRSWEARDVSDVPHSGERIPAGAPICTLFARGEAADTAWENVLMRAQRWLPLIWPH
jgi:uncharacterized protein